MGPRFVRLMHILLIPALLQPAWPAELGWPGRVVQAVILKTSSEIVLTQAVSPPSATSPHPGPNARPAVTLDSLLTIVSRRTDPQPPSLEIMGREFPTDMEVAIPEALKAVADEFFFTSYQFLHEMANHPAWGFFGSKKIRFNKDISTIPGLMSPLFGRMASEQVYAMWAGMRQAGSLSPEEPFEIIELGPGPGTLGRDLLDHAAAQAEAETPEQAAGALSKSAFYRQLRYKMGEFSPGAIAAMNADPGLARHRANGKLEIYEADVLDFLKGLGSGHKGVVLSNEFFDNQMGYQVRLHKDGRAETASFMPALAPPTIAALQARGLLPRDGLKTLPIDGSDLMGLRREDFLALRSRLEEPALTAVKDALRGEIKMVCAYGDALKIPELKRTIDLAHDDIQAALAGQEGPVSAFVSPRHVQIMDLIGHVLGRGYVLSVDYMQTGKAFFHPSMPHLKLFHAPSKTVDWRVDLGDYDATFLVNASLLSRAGEQAGIKTLYMGHQSALETGTSIDMRSLDARTAVFAQILDGVVREIDASDIAAMELSGEEADRQVERMKAMVHLVILAPAGARAAVEKAAGEVTPGVASDLRIMLDAAEVLVNGVAKEVDDRFNTYGHHQFKVLVQEKGDPNPDYRFPLPQKPGENAADGAFPQVHVSPDDSLPAEIRSFDRLDLFQELLRGLAARGISRIDIVPGTEFDFRINRERNTLSIQLKAGRSVWKPDLTVALTAALRFLGTDEGLRVAYDFSQVETQAHWDPEPTTRAVIRGLQDRGAILEALQPLQNRPVEENELLGLYFEPIEAGRNDLLVRLWVWVPWRARLFQLGILVSRDPAQPQHLTVTIVPLPPNAMTVASFDQSAVQMAAAARNATSTNPWEAAGGLGYFNLTRSVWRTLLQDVVAETLGPFMPDGWTLDIGAGEGEMGRLASFIPGFSPDRWLEADSSFALMQSRRAFNSHRLVATLSALPFRAGRIARVVGLCVLNVLSGSVLKDTLEALFRLLPPGGRFVHFQDLYPNLSSEMVEAGPGELLIPFPRVTSERALTYGMLLLDEAALDRSLEEARRAGEDVDSLQGDLNQVMMEFGRPTHGGSGAGHLDVLERVVTAVRRLGVVKKEYPTVLDRFIDRVITAARQTGFVVKSRIVRRRGEVPRAGVLLVPPEVSRIRMVEDAMIMGETPEAPTTPTIDVEAVFHVLELEKPGQQADAPPGPSGLPLAYAHLQAIAQSILSHSLSAAGFVVAMNQSLSRFVLDPVIPLNGDEVRRLVSDYLLLFDLFLHTYPRYAGAMRGGTLHRLLNNLHSNPGGSLHGKPRTLQEDA